MNPVKGLSDREMLFCKYYVETNNAYLSAKMAGYSPNSARVTGCRLLKRKLITTTINKIRKEWGESIGVAVPDIVREMSKIAFSDIRFAMDDETGAMKLVSDMDDNIGASIASIKVSEVFDENGELSGFVKDIKLHNKVRALEVVHEWLKPLPIPQSGDESKSLGKIQIEIVAPKPVDDDSDDDED